MLWWFLVDSKGTQPDIHTYPFSPSSPPSQAATWHWAEFPVLSSRSLLVLHVKYSSVCLSIPNSQSILKSRDTYLLNPNSQQTYDRKEKGNRMVSTPSTKIYFSLSFSSKYLKILSSLEVFSLICVLFRSLLFNLQVFREFSSCLSIVEF